MEPAGARALTWQPPQTQAAFERPLTFFDLQLCSTPPPPPPSFIDEPHHHLILTRCLVAVPLSTSLASATALVPATSPTNSNGNFDPSFLSPPSTQNLQSKSSPVSRGLLHPPSRPRPRVEVFAVYIHRRVVPNRRAMLPPCAPHRPPPSIERSAMTERFQTKRAWLCTGQVACQRYPSGIATPPRRGDAIPEIRERPLSISFGLTILTSYDTAMAGSSVATSLRLVVQAAGCKHTRNPETSRPVTVG